MISTDNADAASSPAEAANSPAEASSPPVGASAPVPPAAPAKPRAGLVEWLYRSRALAAAREAAANTPPLEATRLGRARRALELADRAFDPVDPLRSGSSVALALSLYREAAYWALLAQDQSLAAADLREAFAKARPELLVRAADGEDALSRVRAALVEKDFIATAEDLEPQQQQDAAVAQEFVRALVQAGLEPQARIGRILLQRWSRTLLGVVIVVVAVLGAWLSVRELSQGPDLAAGRPWKASSEYNGCNLREHRCNATPVKIFFHTEEEDSPWVQFDLGKHTRFSHVEVVNRSDFGSDRAFPVVLEASNDGKKWIEVARRDTAYTTWRADFSTASARYVRARVLKHTWFHLEGFHVYAH